MPNKQHLIRKNNSRKIYVPKFCIVAISLNKHILWSLLPNGVFFSEAVAQRCFVKNVFLEILQNSQENIRTRVSLLIKLQVQFY